MDAKESIEQAKRDLSQLKDELRVKMNLAKKDAQTAWKDLEPRIAALEKKLDEATKTGVNEIKAQWPGLQKAMEQVVTDVKKTATSDEIKNAGKKAAKDLEEAANDFKNSVEGLAKRFFK